jgi:hypothetical protein
VEEFTDEERPGSGGTDSEYQSSAEESDRQLRSPSFDKLELTAYIYKPRRRREPIDEEWREKIDKRWECRSPQDFMTSWDYEIVDPKSNHPAGVVRFDDSTPPQHKSPTCLVLAHSGDMVWGHYPQFALLVVEKVPGKSKVFRRLGVGLVILEGGRIRYEKLSDLGRKTRCILE